MENEALEVCGGREGGEARMIICLVYAATKAPFAEREMLDVACGTGTKVNEEGVQRERVFDEKLVIVEDVTGFDIDLFAHSEESRHERADGIAWWIRAGPSIVVLS